MSLTGDLTRLVDENAVENVLEKLAKTYEARCSVSPSKYERIAQVWLEAAVVRLEEECPGNPKKKDFSAHGGETIGERAARKWEGLQAAKSDLKLSELIDLVIADAVCEQRVREWRDKRTQAPAT